MLCVEFPQVQYINLSKLIHVLKAVAIVTMDIVIFVFSHFWIAKVFPEWRLNPLSGTKKKCPFQLYRGVPSIEQS